jgi:hypothetical protein
MAQINLPREFVEDFALWEIDLREDGETDAGIAEIKQVIRWAWGDDELRQLWTDFVAKEAAKRRALIDMARGITERMKTQPTAHTGQQSLSTEA